MKLQRISAAVIIAALMLSGCSSLSLSGPDILAPPRAAGNRAEIQRMVEDDAGGIYSLIYPSAGDYKSGILLHDIDGDGAEEAIALYVAADGTPRMLTAVRDSESYRFLGSTPLRSQSVSSLSFADVNADGKEELLIGSDIGSPLAALDAYVIDGDLPVLPVAEGFVDYVTGDFDGNSSDDILLLNASNGETPAQAVLTVYADGAFSEKSSCLIDETVIAYTRLGFDQIGADIKGAVLDGTPGDGTYHTQAIYYDSASHMLLNPLYVSADYALSARTENVTSADIDGDGITEIPVCTLMEYDKSEDPSLVCSVAHWCVYDAELMELSAKRDALLCTRLSFMLFLSPDYPGAVTARYTADNAVTLYSLTYKDGEAVRGGELLTVKRYEKNSYDSSLTAEGDLYEDARYVYTYILGEGSAFSHDEIENSFFPMEAD